MADEPDTLIDVEEALVSHYDRILNYVRFKTNMQDAEDIAQLVCLRAIAALRRGNGATQHTSGWLWRITNTTIIDYFRKRGSVPEQIELDAEDGTGRTQGDCLPSLDPTPHEQAERTLLADSVHHAIRMLPVRQEDWTQYRMAGYSNAEIADFLGVNETAAKQLGTRAFAGLRERLHEVA